MITNHSRKTHNPERKVYSFFYFFSYRNQLQKVYYFNHIFFLYGFAVHVFFHLINMIYIYIYIPSSFWPHELQKKAQKRRKQSLHVLHYFSTHTRHLAFLDLEFSSNLVSLDRNFSGFFFPFSKKKKKP